nr:nuclear transport factor 2 family protein [uncultured Dyadobacter sp.]
MYSNGSKISIQDDPSAYVGIHQLVHRYTDVINARAWDALPEIFAEHAVWQALSPVDIRFAGLPAIREGIPASVGRTEHLLQFASGIVIGLENECRASVRSHLAEFGLFRDTGKSMQAVGVYRDLAVKQDGVWRFQERTFELKYAGEGLPDEAFFRSGLVT